MPRLKERGVKFAKIQQLLRGRNLNGPKIAVALGVTPPTANKKLEHPELFTIRDLDALNRHYGIPWEEIRESIVR